MSCGLVDKRPFFPPEGCWILVVGGSSYEICSSNRLGIFKLFINKHSFLFLLHVYSHEYMHTEARWPLWVVFMRSCLPRFLKLCLTDGLQASSKDQLVSAAPALGLQECAASLGFLDGCCGSEFRFSYLHGKHFAN